MPSGPSPQLIRPALRCGHSPNRSVKEERISMRHVIRCLLFIAVLAAIVAAVENRGASAQAPPAGAGGTRGAGRTPAARRGSGRSLDAKALTGLGSGAAG